MSIDWSKAPEGATHYCKPHGMWHKAAYNPFRVWGWVQDTQDWELQSKEQLDFWLSRGDLSEHNLLERPKKTITQAVIERQDVSKRVEQLRSIEEARKHSHYFKDVSGVDRIDVYAVLRLFEVTDPCLQHIVKKALCAGKRGAKDWAKDVQEIADTANRLIELEQSK